MLGYRYVKVNMSFPACIQTPVHRPHPHSLPLAFHEVDLKRPLFQRNGLLRTDFLAAEARDTRVRVHLGELVIHG